MSFKNLSLKAKLLIITFIIFAVVIAVYIVINKILIQKSFVKVLASQFEITLNVFENISSETNTDKEKMKLLIQKDVGQDMTLFYVDVEKGHLLISDEKKAYLPKETLDAIKKQKNGHFLYTVATSKNKSELRLYLKIVLLNF